MGNDTDLVLRLGLTLTLCFCVGLERELRQKSAGLRTHALVGLGAAVAMMVSKYGFADVTGQQGIGLDPSRVAAQVVTGVGFIGAGIIFVRRGSVRGLTTAAAIWVTAMIGMACGAGLYVLAVAATVAYFVVVVGFAAVERRVTVAGRHPMTLLVTYEDGKGILRDVLTLLTEQGFAVADVRVDREVHTPNVRLGLEIRGSAPFTDAVDALSQLDGVASVDAGPTDEAP